MVVAGEPWQGYETLQQLNVQNFLFEHNWEN